eukprot:4329855-Alexandrium_andersonii.AAC.1
MSLRLGRRPMSGSSTVTHSFGWDNPSGNCPKLRNAGLCGTQQCKAVVGAFRHFQPAAERT